jgi:hypothetical protein
MATLNFTSSTNNVNPVLWSLSTKLEYHTDREAGAFARGALIDSVNNLGVGVTAGDPFTLLS